ncbi:MAG: substrate-binding domain-containing protein [Proteobacteria bacterium]|nr:substrate-binding domain-containing protein [Pseudomonadota bacterium]
MFARVFTWAICAAALSFSTTTAAADLPFIVLQSTTSTQDTGLFNYLLPMYRELAGVEVRSVAVGTGQALNNAANGDADVLLVHAQADEEKFVAEGFGVERFDLMYNDFVFLGPPEDQANIRGSKDIVEAIKKIAANEAIFASRGDDSGTHKKERELWAIAGIDVDAASGRWYRETGGGMGTTLNIATGIGGYVMSDRATWISFKNKRGFEILVEGDPRLFNQYGIILVNPKRHPHVKAELGQAFIDWLLSESGQKTIADFRVDGQQLFHPNAKAKVQ